MPTTRGFAAPPQGEGYYDRSSGRWWDNHVGHFLPLAMGCDRLEVHVEEVADDSWLARHSASVARAIHAPRYRFVGEARSDDPRWPSYRIVGDVFSTGRTTLFGGAVDARPWASEVLAHLTDFAAHLFERGWQPEGHGQHWWSLQLSRPCVQWPVPAQRWVAEDRSTAPLAVAA